MLRVLVCGFGHVARRGIRAILLEDPDLVVDECGPDAVMRVVSVTRPDTVVINIGSGGELAQAEAAAGARRDMVVVGCSVDRDEMRVYPRGGRPFTLALSAEALIDSVRGAR